MQTNTMAYGWDNFHFQRRALLKSNACWDLSDETSCAGFIIEGTEPAGTSRRVIFQIDDSFYKFGNSGLIEYEERGEFSDIIEGGNTVEELLAVSNIPEFVGKKVFPVIALSADEDAQLMPKIRLKLKINSFNDRYVKNEFSPVFNLRDGAKIKELRASTYTNGHATATVYARIFNPLTGWSDFDYLPNFANKNAAKIQYRVNYVVTTLDGSDFAAVNYIRCFYSTDRDKLSGATQNIISLAQDYPADLKTCYALIKHDELLDAEIKAFVNFSKPVIRRENVMIGTATGESQTLYLSFDGVIDTNIAQDSLSLEMGGKPFINFYYDTENSSVTLQADEGQEIFASYECGAVENWLEMDKDFTQNDGNFYSSRFTYRLANNVDMKRVAVKFEITRLGGNADTSRFGTGTGSLQIFALPHKAKLETLSASGAWNYDEEGQILKTVVNIDNPVEIGYSWQGNLPRCYEYICGFSV